MKKLFYSFLDAFSSKAQECDATMLNFSTAARLQITIPYFKRIDGTISSRLSAAV